MATIVETVFSVRSIPNSNYKTFRVLFSCGHQGMLTCHKEDVEKFNKPCPDCSDKINNIINKLSTKYSKKLNITATSIGEMIEEIKRTKRYPKPGDWNYALWFDWVALAKKEFSIPSS